MTLVQQGGTVDMQQQQHRNHMICSVAWLAVGQQRARTTQPPMMICSSAPAGRRRRPRWSHG